MKKILILILSLLPVITFTACDDKDDIRKDINELNTRLDALTDNLESLNTSIKSFQEAMQGIVLITEYSMDEKGNYTLKMSDGTELTVYSGLPDEDIPVLGVSEDGYWTYTFNGETIKLSSKAKPEDGKDGETPTISIDEEGYWCYTIAGGETQRIGGPYNIADITKIPGSIFANVVVKDNVMTFSFAEGGTTDIPLLGGLNMTFADGATSLTSVTIAKNTLKELKVEQTNVDKIIIDPTPLTIDLTDTSLTIQTTGVDPGVYDVHFQIFSKEGYRLIKSLKVTVSE
ncbi:PL29 family lyase N-terminal domain-containing protein [Bacteroides finegoldii]|uniref:PL29 family lyase N-terminal domain-containing protein n=1 Tax=Bacteroides finegoldii TaxID=338188 RepID=UPI00189DB4F8|nr:PL29 family lyase N-terminal domain-containing protein [Bacteroides finegoldii]